MRQGVVDDLVGRFMPHDAYPEAWDIAGLKAALKDALNMEPPVEDWAKEEGIADEEMRERLQAAADAAFAARVEKNGPELSRYVEKQIVLQVLDHLWREHLVTLDHLRQVIGWRGVAQRDPLNEYKSEAFEMFDGLITKLREIVTAQIMRVEVAFEQPMVGGDLPPMYATHQDPLTGDDDMAVADMNARLAAGDFGPAGGGLLSTLERTEPTTRDPLDPSTWGKVSRNEACPCGTGKKYKHCHGVLA